MSVVALAPEERETIIRYSDADDQVFIWTARRSDITQLRKHPRMVQGRSGFHGSTEWAEFTIPSAEWNPTRGIKRRGTERSEEQKAANTARLHRANRARSTIAA